MPTYDYVCDACGHEFEIFQSMSEGKLRKCPKCGEKVRRLIGLGSGVVFKGSGFYQTDYRSDSYKKRAKSESAGGAGGDASSTGNGSSASSSDKTPGAGEKAKPSAGD